MSRLSQIKREKDDALKNKNKKPITIPVYDTQGNVVSSEIKQKEKKLAIVLLIFAAIVGVFYVPGLFIKDTPDTPATFVKLDPASIRKSYDYLKNHPGDDFDHDGIINSEEVQKKMNPWSIDTDGDFLTDPCEMEYTNTDPLTPDNQIIINAQKKLDKSKNKTIMSPLKIGNVTLWAKDYPSKAIGSVVETPIGYRVCGFNGYAQFPADKGTYPYRYVNGTHQLLNYRSKEKVWGISAGDEIELFGEPLKETIEFTFFGIKFYGPANKVLKLITNILPHKGIFTANVKMKIDIEPDTDIVKAEIDTPVFKEDSDFRFGNNNNSLNDLLYVRESIKSGSCIAVSLFNSAEGEFRGIIYGFDKRGNFLLADQDSLKPIGVLEIKETAYKMMNEKGEIVSISYFDFGSVYYRDSNGNLRMFGSANGDHISFYAASVGNGEGGQLLEDHLKEIVNTEEKSGDEKVGNDALEEIQKKKEEEAAAAAAATATEEETIEETAPVEETTTVEDSSETDGETEETTEEGEAETENTEENSEATTQEQQD